MVNLTYFCLVLANSLVLALLDFTVPKGLQFSISKAPNSQFRTTYAMNALPSLNGSVGYIFTTCDLALKSSGDVRFKDIVDRFKIYGVPKPPEGKPEVFLAGKRVDTRGMHNIPSIIRHTQGKSFRLLDVRSLVPSYRTTRCFLYYSMVTRHTSFYGGHIDAPGFASPRCRFTKLADLYRCSSIQPPARHRPLGNGIHLAN